MTVTGVEANYRKRHLEKLEEPIVQTMKLRRGTSGESATVNHDRIAESGR
jgi:hypothetical protein